MTGRVVRRDAGETLTETLLTVLILGIATAGLVLALATTVRTSTVDRQRALALNALRSWAEQVGAATYTSCVTAGGVPAPSPTPPAGLTAAVTGVQYWDGSAFGTSCGTDTGIQRIGLRVTGSAGPAPGVTETMSVVVRRSCVSAC